MKIDTAIYQGGDGCFFHGEVGEADQPHFAYRRLGGV